MEVGGEGAVPPWFQSWGAAAPTAPHFLRPWAQVLDRESSNLSNPSKNNCISLPDPIMPEGQTMHFE